MSKKNRSNYDFEKAKLEYIEFCKEGKKDIQIFAQPWYLDAVCNSTDDWKVIIYKENNKIIAAFPFEHKKGKWGMWHIRNPWQAAKLGVWVDYTDRDIKTTTKENFEATVCNFIISNLPYYDKFEIFFDVRFKNWQPFYNRGFNQETFYTFKHEPKSLNKVISKELFNQSKRRAIKKYEKCSIEINNDLDTYWDFFEETYKERGRVPFYSKETLKKLHEGLLKNESCKIVYCMDKGTPISADYYIVDKKKSYRTFTTLKAQTGLGAQPFMVYNSIVSTLKADITYDFGGSMIEGVATFIREMGGEREPYFRIYKYSSKYICINSIREFFSELKNWVRGK